MPGINPVAQEWAAKCAWLCATVLFATLLFAQDPVAQVLAEFHQGGYDATLRHDFSNFSDHAGH